MREIMLPIAFPGLSRHVNPGKMLTAEAQMSPNMKAYEWFGSFLSMNPMSFAADTSPMRSPIPFGRRRRSDLRKRFGTKSDGMLFIMTGYTPIIRLTSEPDTPGIIIATAPRTPAMKSLSVSPSVCSGSVDAMSDAVIVPSSLPMKISSVKATATQTISAQIFPAENFFPSFFSIM